MVLPLSISGRILDVFDVAESPNENLLMIIWIISQKQNPEKTEGANTEINLLHKSKNELKVEIVGEGHTLCIALYEMLLKDDKIDFIGYDISHPLIGKPIFYIRMKGRKKAEKALVDAAGKLCMTLDTLQKVLKKTIQKNNKILSS